MTDGIRLGLTGDVMLGRNVDTRHRDGSPAAVWGTVADRLSELDGLVINLECCLSTRGEHWERTHRPFHFRADPGWAVPALAAAGVDCCVLANNHLLDFEEVALKDTLEHLDDAGIARVGAGRDLDEALEPAVWSIAGQTVAVVAFTDNTPEYAAGPNSPGVARVEMDVEDGRTREVVEEALARAATRDPDLLVASLHWGPNMVETPPAAFERFGRWLVAQGVDVVHGHSAHVFQGIEVHEGAPILYDTGDFVDDYAVDADLRNDRSFLFELRVVDGHPEELRLIPTEIDGCSVHHADADVARWSRRRMRELAAPYGTDVERAGTALVVSLR